MNTRFAVAQLSDNENNIIKNLESHKRFISAAKDCGVNFISFPEMSITGYVRLDDFKAIEGELVRSLEQISQMAIETRIAISVGAPICEDQKHYIASIIFDPQGNKSVYYKKYLHPGEEQYFSSRNDRDPITTISGEIISNAICYDIENKEHLESESVRKSSIYSASIFYSNSGIESGINRLKKIAVDTNNLVVMANYCGTCWGVLAGGKSSIIEKDGRIISQAGSEMETLVVGTKTATGWVGNIYKI